MCYLRKKRNVFFSGDMMQMCVGFVRYCDTYKLMNVKNRVIYSSNCSCCFLKSLSCTIQQMTIRSWLCVYTHENLTSLVPWALCSDHSFNYVVSPSADAELNNETNISPPQFVQTTKLFLCTLYKLKLCIQSVTKVNVWSINIKTYLSAKHERTYKLFTQYT